MKRRHSWRWLLLAVPLVLLLAALFAPWQPWLEKKLVAALAAKGFAPVTLTLDRIGIHGLVLRDVSLGEPPLTLQNVTVGYSLDSLRRHALESVRLDGLSLRLVESDAGWVLAGLPPLPTSPARDAPITIPVTHAALSALPFRTVAIEKSSLGISGKGIEATLPFALHLTHDGQTKITLETKDALLANPATSAALGGITATLTLDEAAQQWLGSWEISDIHITADAMAVPVLKASGSIILNTDRVQCMGTLHSEDKTYLVDFASEYSFAKPEASRVTIATAHLPWNGGRVTLDKTSVAPTGKAPIALTLNVEHVAIDSLLQALTGNKATGTGVVSGKLPLVITRDGAVSVGKSSLKADGPGTIALSPEVIPGDNAQVAIVRELLKNLHFTVLSLDLAMAPDHTLAANLVVEGNNPEVERGRPVKLNVHLSGDLLNFIVQNNRLLADPKSFIEQNTHE